MKDTGLGVRKRVIKLLKIFYCMTEDVSKKVDICSKVILRLLDEDDSVKVTHSPLNPGYLLTILDPGLGHKNDGRTLVYSTSKWETDGGASIGR